jgi:hypothetical protein
MIQGFLAALGGYSQGAVEQKRYNQQRQEQQQQLDIQNQYRQDQLEMTRNANKDSEYNRLSQSYQRLMAPYYAMKNPTAAKGYAEANKGLAMQYLSRMNELQGVSQPVDPTTIFPAISADYSTIMPVLIKELEKLQGNQLGLIEARKILAEISAGRKSPGDFYDYINSASGNKQLAEGTPARTVANLLPQPNADFVNARDKAVAQYDATKQAIMPTAQSAFPSIAQGNQNFNYASQATDILKAQQKLPSVQEEARKAKEALANAPLEETSTIPAVPGNPNLPWLELVPEGVNNRIKNASAAEKNQILKDKNDPANPLIQAQINKLNAITSYLNKSEQLKIDEIKSKIKRSEDLTEIDWAMVNVASDRLDFAKEQEENTVSQFNRRIALDYQELAFKKISAGNAKDPSTQINALNSATYRAYNDWQASAAKQLLEPLHKSLKPVRDVMYGYMNAQINWVETKNKELGETKYIFDNISGTISPNPNPQKLITQPPLTVNTQSTNTAGNGLIGGGVNVNKLDKRQYTRGGKVVTKYTRGSRGGTNTGGTSTGSNPQGTPIVIP